MAITRASGQTAKGLTDGSTSVSVAYPGNVTAGNLLVIGVVRGSSQADGSDPIVVGDISKSAGTATLGTFTLDVALEQSLGANGYSNVAIFSAPVTGTGSCTIQAGGGPSSSYWVLVVQEYAGADISGARVAGTNTGTNAGSTTPLTGTVASGGPGVFFGAFTSFQSAACTITPQAAFSTVQEEENGSLHQVGAAEDQIVSGATTDAAEWTLGTSGSWAAAVAVYKEAGASRKWLLGAH